MGVRGRLGHQDYVLLASMNEVGIREICQDLCAGHEVNMKALLNLICSILEMDMVLRLKSHHDKSWILDK